ncbi:uncharacterized protein LOC128185199 [Crassostrea angulata]|uniref:uncharacterized protein LOC128185199 n=1 Tax=Magallana angulata TaxID=2784310 RepID=UPI0022B0EA14|nr:uncharacterized protein LOC128185199 [Crassostrea angulata]
MTDKQKQVARGIVQKWREKAEKTDQQKQIYLGIAQKWRKKTQKNQDREYLDSKTGTYKLREYRPRSPDTPKLREYKPKFKEVKVREYVPKSHVTGNQYVTLREYDHTYEVEPPDDDDRPTGEPRFCKPYRAIGSIKRTLAMLFPPVR